MHYANPAVDEALERARTALAPEARREAYREFCRLFADDQPVTLLYHTRMSLVVHRRFEGAEVGAFGLDPREWWVPPEAQRHRWGIAQQPSVLPEARVVLRRTVVHAV